MNTVSNKMDSVKTCEQRIDDGALFWGHPILAIVKARDFHM